MKTLIAVILLIAFATEAEARTRKRITVHPVQRPIVTHPYAVDYLLRSILCAFHVFSVGPQGTPGSCAQHLPTRPAHRVV